MKETLLEKLISHSRKPGIIYLIEAYFSKVYYL